jgi:hypothetical protein
MDNKNWTPAIPKYTKYPRSKHITIRNVYDHFHVYCAVNEDKKVKHEKESR